MDVIDNGAEQRFELELDGLVAHADYALQGNVIIFTHTIVPEALGGRGVGSQLIAAALSSARARGLKVDPQCEFVAAYIGKHPEHEDLLARNG